MFYNKEWTFLTIEEFSRIQKSFELKNLKKIQDMKMWLRNWQKQPDFIKHYIILKEKWLVKVPVGVRWIWQDRFIDNYWQVVAIKHPQLINPFWDEEDLDLTEKQIKAVDELLQTNIGLLHADTAVWKTRITAMIIDKLRVKTLIICSGLELMNQMKDDLEIFFGIKCRTISGIKTKQKDCYEDIVIWNIDSLVKLPEEYFKQFDLVIMDEYDTYLWSDNRRDFIYSLPMKYQYWLTWTIKINHIDDKIFSIYLWKKTELLSINFQPTIYKVVTDFEYILDDIKDFHELKEALYTDEDRNNLIVDTIIKTIDNRKWIVFCEHVKHSELICNKLEEKWVKTFMLIWKIKKDERVRIKQELKNYKWWPCCLVGNVTIIWRWFNVAELSIWYLTVCEKFTSNISQYCWRIIRKFPWKTTAIWYDFIDTWCSLLSNQAKSRTTTYKKKFPWSKIIYYK